MGEGSARLDELLGRAEVRGPWVPDDTKSGARFERVLIDGESFVLKYQDPRDDWLLRATGDPGRCYVRLWESGLLGRLPPVIDHAVVAADFDGTVGRVCCATSARPCSPLTRPSRSSSTGASSSTWPRCTPPSGDGTTTSA